MTIPAGQTSITTSTGNGVATNFNYLFKITDKTDLLVTTIDLVGAETVLTVDVDYTVNGVGDAAGGSIDLLGGPLTNLWTIAIQDNVAVSQTTVYANQTSFFGVKHEDSYDKNVRLIKRLWDSVGNAFKLPAYITGKSTTLPVPVAYEGIRWNSGATALEAVRVMKSIASGSGNVQVVNNADGTWTISAVGMGGGDVTEAGDNNFTGDNTFSGENRFTSDRTAFPSASAIPVATSDYGEVQLVKGQVYLMKGDGTAAYYSRLTGLSDTNPLSIGTFTNYLEWESLFGKELIYSYCDIERSGKVTHPQAFANLAAITAFYSGYTPGAAYGAKCYVTSQGWATYEPPAVTGLGADAWVKLADPTVAIT